MQSQTLSGGWFETLTAPACSARLVRRNAVQQTSDWLIGQLPNCVEFAITPIAALTREPGSRATAETFWQRRPGPVVAAGEFNTDIGRAEPRPDTAKSQR